MSISKHKIFARMREEAKNVASCVKDEPNFEEVANILTLLNQYIKNPSQDKILNICKQKMPAGYLNARNICGIKNRIISEINRRDGIPICVSALAASLLIVSKECQSSSELIHIAGEDRGILQICLM